MVAAAATIWLMFAFWIVAPHLGVGRGAARVAAILMATELIVLLAYSYATDRCTGEECSPLAQAVGVAARVDVPLIAGAFVALVVGRGLRRGAA